MPVTYVIEFHVKPAERARFLSLLGDVLSAMADEANYRNATLHVSPDDPLHFMLYETWASHEDVLNVQLQRPYRNAWHAALPEILEQPREISIWRPFEEAHRGGA